MCFPCAFPLDPGLSQYSKLLLASPAQVLSLLAEERAALQLQLSLEGEAQSCFIQSALCHLQVRNALYITHLLMSFPGFLICFYSIAVLVEKPRKLACVHVFLISHVLS